MERHETCKDKIKLRKVFNALLAESQRWQARFVGTKTLTNESRIESKSRRAIRRGSRAPS